MQQMPLLQTKLHIPPVRPERVPRPRLIKRLDGGLRTGHRLTLVSAPAGFGKTIVSYLFKQFVDRFACTFHRPSYWGKYALTVAVAGNIGLKETGKYLKDVATAWGFEVVDEWAG